MFRRTRGFARRILSAHTRILGRVLLAVCLLGHAVAWAQEDQTLSEYRLKAAFLYKFAGFVEWPESLKAQPSINIGVLGSETMRTELAQILPGRTVNNRSLTVRSVDARDIASDLHILFVPKSEHSRLAQLAPLLQSRGVLIASESDDGLAQGSTINFIIVDQRVKFEISMEAAEKSRLKLSSRLLAVAHRVAGAP